MRFLIKICGITTPEDAAMAAAAGADALGINLWPGSRRYVAPEAVAAVLAAIPPHVLKVGVFVNAAPAEVMARVLTLGLDRAQLHGDEQPADFAGVPRERLMRAIRVKDAASLAEAAAWAPDLFLYDAFVDGYGGGGALGPWDVVAACARRPFLLAGGLTPENVADAIRATRPNGVDVASGVELAPGKKDARAVAAFIANARAAVAAKR